MKVEILREDSDGPARYVLAKSEDGQYFRVSTVIAFDTHKMETLCFPCDENAVVSRWTQFAGGIGMTRSQAIADLEERLDTGEEKGSDEFIEEMGGYNFGTLLDMVKKSGGSEPNPEDLK